eukprot:2792977-Lingulodinium_polyedra.AAC.1
MDVSPRILEAYVTAPGGVRTAVLAAFARRVPQQRVRRNPIASKQYTMSAREAPARSQRHPRS